EQGGRLHSAEAVSVHQPSIRAFKAAHDLNIQITDPTSTSNSSVRFARPALSSSTGPSMPTPTRLRTTRSMALCAGTYNRAGELEARRSGRSTSAPSASLADGGRRDRGGLGSQQGALRATQLPASPSARDRGGLPARGCG